MRSLKEHKHLFAYDHWANQEAIVSIKKLHKGRARSVQLLSHIAEAGNLWYLRILQDYKKIEGVWSHWPLERCEEEMSFAHSYWNTWLDSSPESILSNRIGYTNTKGVAYENSVEEILTHVINHATYHRAQIAAEVRKAGGEPAYTDYIQFCRIGA